MNRLIFEPIFGSVWGLLLIAGLLLMLPWVVPVAGRTVTPQRKRTLQWLRTGCVMLILIAMFRPAWVRTESQPNAAALAILVDRSQSMTLPANATQSRFQIENQLVGQLHAELSGLDESLDLKWLQYAGQSRDLSVTTQDLKLLESPPDGNETRISAALSAAVRAAGGKPLAGVILIGDGVEVRGNSLNQNAAATDESEQGGARLLASLDVPLFTVPIGPPGDLQQLRDIEVDGLPEAYSLFAGNESEIDFVVKTRAMSGANVKLNLQLQREDGGPPFELATRTFSPDASVKSSPMKIPVVAPEPGRYLLTVKAEGQEGETLLTNNAQVAFVDVRKGGGRVLYLEGQPRPEQSFLLRTLRRFPDLQVTYRWLALDNPELWPIDLGDTLSTEPFDLVIIGNLPAAALGREQLKRIQERVGKGASLLMIGGPQTFAAGGYASEPFAVTLPVKLDPALADRTDSIVAVPTQTHAITRLTSDPSPSAQQKFWASLPPFVGSNRFADVRVAPGVQVILEAPDEEPLLVVGEYGAGRVATFAIDSTWRWWRQQQSESHRRFWRQMMLWLLNRDGADDQLLELRLARRRVMQGEPVEYQIVQSGSEVLPAEAFKMEWLKDGQVLKQIPTQDLIKTTSNSGAVLSGQITAEEPGLFQLSIGKEGDGESLAVVTFQVISNDSELRQPYADHVYLSQLASLTSSAGGAMFMPEESEQLIHEIKQLRRRSEAPIAKKYRVADTPATAWPLFIGITSLLAIEWYLRRRWGLA